MKKIKLNGKYAIGQYEFALVDNEDFEELNKYNWHLSQSGRKDIYLTVRARDKAGSVVMARKLMGFPEGLEVDHKDGNTVNNQKENLRVGSHGNNMRNKARKKGGDSKYIGITFDKKVKKYKGRLRVGKKDIYTGWSFDEKEAARWRDLHAIYYFDDWCRLNFPEKLEEYKKILAEWTDYYTKEREEAISSLSPCVIS